MTFGRSSPLKIVFLVGQALVAQLLPSRFIITAHRACRALLFRQCGRINAPAFLHDVAVRDRRAEIGGRAASFLFTRRVVVHPRRRFDA